MTNKFKKLIGKVKQVVETQTSLLQKKSGNYKLECAVDEEKVDCKEFEQDYEHINDDPHDGWWLRPEYSGDYTGVPAPAYLEDDPWFGSAPTPTEKQMDYMVQEAEIKMAEEQQRSEQTCESHDIHAKMYEIATKNWTTVAETQGGSENFQEGPGGWNSGTGINQFPR